MPNRYITRNSIEAALDVTLILIPVAINTVTISKTARILEVVRKTSALTSTQIAAVNVAILNISHYSVDTINKKVKF